MTTREFLLSAWNWSPLALAAGAAGVFACAKSARFRWRSESGWFIAGVIAFYLTLASPLNTLANGYLFSAHMLQHLLLLLVVPPLLLLGWPPAAIGNEGKFRLPPFAGWVAGVGAMWFWHERTLCDAAATNPPVRVIQVISLLALGAMFWWPIVGPRAERRLPPLLGVLYLFSACVGCTILGILITFAPVGAVCPIFMHPRDPLGIAPLLHQTWGITPAMDQQVGGLLMWVPACGIYLGGIMALLARWYRSGAAASEAAPAFPAHGITGGQV